jgi:hypothetical protein
LQKNNRKGWQKSIGYTLLNFGLTLQGQFSPWFEEELGPLGDRHKKFVTVLEVMRVATFVHHYQTL